MSFVGILRASKFIQTLSWNNNNNKGRVFILPEVKSYYNCTFLLQTLIELLLKNEFLMNSCCIIATYYFSPSA